MHRCQVEARCKPRVSLFIWPGDTGFLSSLRLQPWCSERGQGGPTGTPPQPRTLPPQGSWDRELEGAGETVVKVEH